MATERQATFSELLRHYRTAAGFTQEELAERARMSRRAISDLERGARTRPWRDTVELLAGALNLTPEERKTIEDAITRVRKPVVVPAVLQRPEPLPADVTPLIGRERQEAAIVHLLRRADLRLLTLTGSGGVGKTRLALRAASTQASTYADGVRFVPLAPLRASKHVTSAIASSLALQEIRGQTLRQTLQNYLRPRSILLLLDNFEHVLEAGPLLTELLASCPQLVMLVTSREPLHLQGEQIYQVPPLSVPPTIMTDFSADDLSRYSATALFLARARAVTPGIHIEEPHVAAVRDISRQLDGLPLALELAAAQLKYMSPHQLLLSLQRRFEVLVGGPRDAPTRQRTMRDCVAWSYDLLIPEEQEVLTHLAVFVGGFTTDAAQQALRFGEVQHSNLTPILHSLVDKSLLVADWTDNEVTRFTMLETIREYVLERLVESGRHEQASSAYAHHYLALSEEAESAIWGPDEATYYRRLATELDNVRAVLAWALDHDPELGLRIVGAIRRFWAMDGHYSEWQSWIEQALASNSHIDPMVRAKALLVTGWLVMHAGNVEGAVDRFGEVLAIARSLGDLSLVWLGLIGHGLAELGRGNSALAMTMFREGIGISHDLGATRLLGPSLYGLGLSFQGQGDVAHARRHLEEAVKHLEAQGECYTIGAAQRALGGANLVQGEYDQARGWFQEGLRNAVLNQHREGIANALDGLAAVLGALGQIERAARFWGASESIHQELNGLTERTDEVPFARLPLLSPHLTALSGRFTDPKWKSAQDEGYAAPLEQTIADALQVSDDMEQIPFK